MKLATFTHEGSTRIGVVDGDEVVDLAAARPDLPQDMLGFLEAGDEALVAASSAVADGPRIALSDVQLEAPIARPPKFIAVGLNYADHVAESGQKTPEYPILFNKQIPGLRDEAVLYCGACLRLRKNAPSSRS